MMVTNLRLENPEQALAVVAHLKSSADSLSGRLLTALNYLGGEIRDRIRQHASANFQQESGKLMRSIFYSVKIQKAGNTYVMTSGVSRRAFYAAFQERGVPLRLVAIKRGKRRYERILFLKARPFIGPSIAAMEDEIKSVIAEAYKGTWTGGA